MRYFYCLLCLFIAPTAIANPSNGQSLATTLIALLAVIALIFGLGKFAKKMQGSANNGKAVIKIIAQLPLGQKERIMVLDVGGEQVLIGVTAHQISLLKNIDNAVNMPESVTATTAKTESL